MPNLESDIVGQVARLPLRPSEASALLPLHEAVMNSLHAIQERFGEKGVAEGRIDIRLLREEDGSKLGPVVGFEVTDNGIGLHENNYRSFLTPFSMLKVERGGKGVGRLGWLKVFNDIRVHSGYQTDEGIALRDFNFVLRKREQIVVHHEGLNGHSVLGTKVTMKQFIEPYGTKCPAKTNTIALRLIAHFLPIFAGDMAPDIYLHDDQDGEVIDLKGEFASKVKRSSEVLLEIDVDGEKQPFIVRHMQCDKSIRPRGGQHHWLCFCADDRGVKEYSIDEQIGLLSLLDGEDIYVGAVTGDFLDKHVNPQRTDFTFEAEDSRILRRRVADSVREFLSDYLDAVMAHKRSLAQAIIAKNPQYLYLLADMDGFLHSLAPNSTSEEVVIQEMSLNRYRRQRRFNGVREEIKGAERFTEAIAAKVEEYKAYIVDDQKGALAEYVVKRKSVLDLLDQLLGFNDPEKGKYEMEEAIHSLICPMRVDSHQLEIEDHKGVSKTWGRLLAHLWLAGTGSPSPAAAPSAASRPPPWSGTSLPQVFDTPSADRRLITPSPSSRHSSGRGLASGSLVAAPKAFTRPRGKPPSGRVLGQPFPHGLIEPRLPARPGRAQPGQQVGIQSNRHLPLRIRQARPTASAPDHPLAVTDLRPGEELLRQRGRVIGIDPGACASALLHRHGRASSR